MEKKKKLYKIFVCFFSTCNRFGYFGLKYFSFIRYRIADIQNEIFNSLLDRISTSLPTNHIWIIGESFHGSVRINRSSISRLDVVAIWISNKFERQHRIELSWKHIKSSLMMWFLLACGKNVSKSIVNFRSKLRLFEKPIRSVICDGFWITRILWAHEKLLFRIHWKNDLTFSQKKIDSIFRQRIQTISTSIVIKQDQKEKRRARNGKHSRTDWFSQCFLYSSLFFLSFFDFYIFPTLFGLVSLSESLEATEVRSNLYIFLFS